MMNKLRSGLMIMIATLLSITFISCNEDSDEQPVKQEVTSQQVSAKKSESKNGRFAYSNPAVVFQIESMGYVQDVNDVEHYSLYVGGSYDITMHIRGDASHDEKYKILYESTGHVGEELLFNGYIANTSVFNTVYDALGTNILQ